MVQRKRHGRLDGQKPSHLRRPKVYKVLCSGCGKEIVTQVPAPNDRKLLCTECFSQSPTYPEELTEEK